MYDNKIRLSQDVLEKAELIAQEWGLKNARAAVEAVFRKYADEYLSRHSSPAPVERIVQMPVSEVMPKPQPKPPATSCDALSELDELLGL